MARYILLAVAGLALYAMITRSRQVWRTLLVMLGLVILYTVLKLTGLIEAIAPDRIGVF